MALTIRILTAPWDIRDLNQLLRIDEIADSGVRIADKD